MSIRSALWDAVALLSMPTLYLDTLLSPADAVVETCITVGVLQPSLEFGMETKEELVEQLRPWT